MLVPNNVVVVNNNKNAIKIYAIDPYKSRGTELSKLTSIYLVILSSIPQVLS